MLSGEGDGMLCVTRGKEGRKEGRRKKEEMKALKWKRGGGSKMRNKNPDFR